ncbi:DUF465 domain-containing protein [Paraneptunicella aestuarii]|uniref:YdcH family protein n=1 Tax=Paraneptunicella aestuarii TaxID=2831148 RepID=UPI001E34101B|nr:DUF465 domain-containing protein [Paraneptunicella aestuarii]UAA37687.1 DUF465 domain-containing protein [Paraneptunicella aestuarii]
MPVSNHSLANELPEYKDKIHELKMSDNHFHRLHNEYDEIDHEIHRIENGTENTSDMYLEDLKKKRLYLKDIMFDMLKKQA